MHRALRLVALVGATTLALAFAGSALAAYTPKFTVSHVPVNGSPTTTITIEQTQAEDATAKVTFYAPVGYSGVLTQAAGTKLGTVAAHVQATAISQDAILPINGDVLVASSADAAIAAASTACTGTTTHSAFWVLALEASGQKLSVPVFIDEAAAGFESTFASFKLQVCLPPPAAATFGAKLLDAALTVSNVFTAPSSPGTYVWPAIFTPYSSAAGPANPAGTVQSRAVVRLPARITLKGKITSKKKRTVSFSGAVTENSAGVGGARVQLLLGTTVGFTATTKANGSYAFSLKKKGKKGTTTFRARVTVPARSITAAGCALPIPNLPAAPAGCVSAIASPFTATSGAVRIKL